MIGEFSPEVDWNIDCSQPVDSLPASFLTRIERRNGGVSLHAAQRSTSRGRRGVSKRPKGSYKSVAESSVKASAEINVNDDLQQILHIQCSANLPEKRGKANHLGSKPNLGSQLTSLDSLEKLLPLRKSARIDTATRLVERITNSCSDQETLQTKAFDRRLVESSQVPNSIFSTPNENIRSTPKLIKLGDQKRPRVNRPHARTPLLNRHEFENIDSQIVSRTKSPIANFASKLLNSNACDSDADSKSDFNSSILDDDLIVASQMILEEDETSCSELVPQKIPDTSWRSKSGQQASAPVSKLTICTSSSNVERANCIMNSKKCVSNRQFEVRSGLDVQTNDQSKGNKESQFSSAINDSLDSLFMSKSQPLSTDEGFDSDDEDFFNIEIESDDSFANAVADFDFEINSDPKSDYKKGDFVPSISNNSKSAHIRSDSNNMGSATETQKPPSKFTFKPNSQSNRSEKVSVKSTPGKSRSFKRCSSFQQESSSSISSKSSSIQSQIELKRRQALEKLNKNSQNKLSK